MQETSSIPHGLFQILSLVLASSLGWVGGWLTRRRREPVEIAKLSAETKQIHITADNSQTSINLELLREIRNVTEKAEVRREAWLLREEQLRNQVSFWRNKSEELDGELIDSREANQLLEIRLKHHENQEKKMKALMDLKGIKLSDADLV